MLSSAQGSLLEEQTTRAHMSSSFVTFVNLKDLLFFLLYSIKLKVTKVYYKSLYGFKIEL